MRVLVLGSGVVGTTTAYYLARAGAKVTVIDRQPAPAMETSFANAGQVSPGYSTPWAAPGIPLKALKWLFQRHAPLAIRADGSLFQLRWMMEMLRNCTAERYAENKARMMRLSEYSRDTLRTLRSDTGLHYEERSKGTLQLFRSAAQLEAARQDIRVLEEFGVPYELLDRDGLIRAEPALARADAQLVGGLRLPNDETGDCQLFATRLAEMARDLGVEYRFGVSVDEILTGGGGIIGVRVGEEVLSADRYVLALGSYSPKLARPIGFDLPIYPVKGYSLTLPVADEAMAPVSTIMDETYKVAVTRFADRIRVGGMAELTGFDDTLKEKRRATLEMVVSDLFPQGGKVAEATFWTGFRPMTPDGTPIIGASSLRNLYFNTGHGTLGWTMSCGSSKLLADLLSGEKPALNAGDYSFDRYSNHKEHQHHGHPASAH